MTALRVYCATAKSWQLPKRSASAGRRVTRPSRPAPVEYCLGIAGIRAPDLEYVGFYDKPLLKFERILETYLGVAPRGFGQFRAAGPVWMREKLFPRPRDPASAGV